MKKSSRKAKILLALGGLLVIFGIWAAWANTALMASHFEVSSRRLPQAFSGFRIAQVSDLHNAEFGAGNRELLDLLAESTPDIIAVTGDFVDGAHPDTEAALNFAREALQIAPVFYVTGNHEARLSQYGEYRTELEALGVTVLEDAAVPIKRGEAQITLIGLSDPSFAPGTDTLDTPSTAARLEALTAEAEGYTVLLAHRPELFETYASCGIDLVLSGHAHGGQFRLPLVGGLVAPNQGFFPQYDGGLYCGGTTHMVVSRGLGNSVIPIRIHNRPELVVITLQSVNASD